MICIDVTCFSVCDFTLLCSFDLVSWRSMSRTRFQVQRLSLSPLDRVVMVMALSSKTTVNQTWWCMPLTRSPIGPLLRRNYSSESLECLTGFLWYCRCPNFWMVFVKYAFIRFPLAFPYITPHPYHCLLYSNNCGHPAAARYLPIGEDASQGRKGQAGVKKGQNESLGRSISISASTHHANTSEAVLGVGRHASETFSSFYFRM